MIGGDGERSVTLENSLLPNGDSGSKKLEVQMMSVPEIMETGSIS